MPNPLEGVDQSNDPYIIVSSDTHAGLYVEDYRAYLESSVHAEFDEWLQTRHEHRAMVEEMNGEYVEQWERENEWGLQGAYDPEIRDKALDADGIAGEVIFADGDAVTGMEAPPFGAGLHAGAITDPKLAWAGARAHNRWLEEFCASNPPRRAGVALVPITHGVEESVKEIYALADKPGIKGIMIPTMWHDAESYGHEKYDPIWQACHETGLVVHTHSGEADAEAYNENMAQYMLEVAFWTHRPLWQFLLSGKFDKYPNFKYVPVECGSWWLGDLLWKTDVMFGGTNWKVKKMSSRTKGLIERLPPELIRKGRVDELFFVDLPKPEVRKTILQIHHRQGQKVVTLDQASHLLLVGVGLHPNHITGHHLSDCAAELSHHKLTQRQDAR